MAPAFAPGGRESVVRPGVLLVGCALPLRWRTAPGSASMGRTLYEQECAMDTWVWIVIGVVVAALLITWLNAGMLLAFPEGAEGSRYQLLALGLVLVLSALLNTFALRRYGRLA